MALDREARWRQQAQRFADTRGKAMTLRRTTSTFDPATGDTTESTSDTSIDASSPRAFSPERIDGTLIQDGDAVVAIPAQQLTTTPTPETDSVLIDGVEWQVVRVQPRYAGEQVTTYSVQVRK